MCTTMTNRKGGFLSATMPRRESATRFGVGSLEPTSPRESASQARSFPRFQQMNPPSRIKITGGRITGGRKWIFYR